MNGITARTAAATSAGILTARVAPGRAWEAVRTLRDAIRELRSNGASPRLAFLYGIGEDGTLTSLGSSRVIVIGYE